jgi:hypothetical protein
MVLLIEINCGAQHVLAELKEGLDSRNHLSTTFSVGKDVNLLRNDVISWDSYSQSSHLGCITIVPSINVVVHYQCSPLLTPPVDLRWQIYHEIKMPIPYTAGRKLKTRNTLLAHNPTDIHIRMLIYWR